MVARAKLPVGNSCMRKYIFGSKRSMKIVNYLQAALDFEYYLKENR